MIDLVGKKFGRLIVIQRMDNDKFGNLRWLCQCDCGKEKIIRGSSFNNDHTRSCGCLNKEIITKHGHSTTATYESWRNMKQRCYNPKDKSYPYYGGRGIKVCKRWREFVNFLEDMGERPNKKYTLDRIKNKKGYCKANCRWATRKEQAGNRRNRRSNHLILFNGKNQCIMKWSEETGISYKTLYARIYIYNWLPKKALTTLIRKKKNNENIQN